MWYLLHKTRNLYIIANLNDINVEKTKYTPREVAMIIIGSNFICSTVTMKPEALRI